MGKRAYRNEVIYLVISSGLVEGKNARNIITRVLLKRKTGNRAFLIVNLNAKSFAAGKLEREGEGKEEKFSR